MKRSLQVVLVASSAALLAACASGGSMTRASPEPYQTSPKAMVQDAEYIAYVEALARRRGVNVQWVNPPLRRVADHQASTITP